MGIPCGCVYYLLIRTSSQHLSALSTNAMGTMMSGFVRIFVHALVFRILLAKSLVGQQGG